MMVALVGLGVQPPFGATIPLRLASAAQPNPDERLALKPACFEPARPQAPATSPDDCTRDPARRAAPLGPEGRPASYYHTCGSKLYDAEGRQVEIVGLNWAGMETASYAPAGLMVRNWEDILDQVVALGYNTVRLPFSNEGLEPGRKVSGVDFSLNPDLRGLSGLEMLDRLVAGARARGLKVILDRHRPTSLGQSELWYTAEVPEERWIADWRMLAARYYGDDTVIGVDLHNEPHGDATWGTGDSATDWRLAAERAGNAVLEVNPYLLVFVQGIDRHDGELFWWGGELQGVRQAPVRLSVPGRLVYSPRDYGPSVWIQGWFRDPRFPANLPDVWDRHWGFVAREGIAPVVLGELGGHAAGSDQGAIWRQTITAYLRQHGIGAVIWSLNPNGDTGGIFSEDWQSVESAKHEAYRQILDLPGDSDAGPARLRVLFRQVAVAERSAEIAFEFRVVNDRPDPLDLSRVELRYWYTAGSLGERWQIVEPGATDPAGTGVAAGAIPVEAGGQDHYVRVRFGEGGVIEPYRMGPKVRVSLHRSDRSRYIQVNDHSFASAPALHERLGAWDRVTLYLDGRLVWGREP